MDNQTPSANTEQYISSLFAKDKFKDIASNSVMSGLPDVDLTPLEGHILAMLTRMIGAKYVVEFGTLAGYSTAWIYSGMNCTLDKNRIPDDGALITYEVNSKYAEIARENLSNVNSNIEIRCEDAHEAIKTLDGTFDLVFIDADKAGYDDYLTWALAHVRVGGLIIAHNALWHGKVVSFMSIPYADTTDDTTQTLRAFNVRVANEPRLKAVILPVGDGLLIAQVVK